MSDPWGTREQPSDRDPGRLRTEHAYLILAVVSVSAALVLYTIDSQLPSFQTNIGVYPILLSFFIAGYGGWLTHSSERRMRRTAAAEFRRMSAAIDRLERQVRAQRFTYPAARRISEGQRYLGSVAVGADDNAAPTPTAGIDPASIAAARRISSRLRGVDNEQPQVGDR
ncbi:hypothetical protein [Micromonospora sp. NPDC005113]